ncbi:putative mitochondrial HMG-like protein [Candida maltosa Xu316]|uniref:Putative mitochondrial HMG-like protein n=1 Tax=Candida maltosa (strain Xu316) TaxID=1245528 RepID=M3JCC6_CANMX|nr:putative mitochondrial HMG-like protein [Candida maltosa Xu316]
MLRSFVSPIRSIGINGVKPLTQYRFLTSSTTLFEGEKKKAKATKAPAAKGLTAAIKSAKKKHATIASAIKKTEAEHKKLAKARKEEEKVRAQQKGLEKKATTDPHSLNSMAFFVKVSGRGITDASEAFKNLSEEERQKYEEAREAYNIKAKSFFTPRPKFAPSPFCKYIKENYVFHETPTKSLKLLSEKWNTLAADEKAKYVVSPEEQKAGRKALQDWKQLRLKEYPKYLEFKENYKFEP